MLSDSYNTRITITGFICASKVENMKTQLLATVSFVAFFAGCTEKTVEPPVETEFTLAFGSCATQEIVNPMWDAIAGHQPDVFIWMGDNIYGDSEDMDVLKDKYKRQKEQEAYQRFLKGGTPVIGTWDDHDYGGDDAGKEYPYKTESKELMLAFLDIPADAEVRKRAGVYQSYLYKKGNLSVKVILLDTRWFRDPLAKDTTGRGRFMPSEEGDMLGEAQWAWLQLELDKSTADVNIIVSSVQVVAEEHGWEKWANLSLARKRLFNMLENTQAKNIIIISGDRHQAEISRTTLPNGKLLNDITSSGMTHVFPRPDVEPNRFRSGPLVMKRNWGLMKIVLRNDSVFAQTEFRGAADSLFYAEQLKL
jgi:alkaline phosphatase D